MADFVAAETITGYFTGHISKKKDGTNGFDYNVEFKLDNNIDEKMTEIAKRLSNGEKVEFKPPTPATTPIPESKTSGGKSIKKRGGKIRKTKKHGNKKYRNKK